MDWTDLMIRLQAGDFDRFMTRNFPQSQNDEKITHWITENVQIPPPQNWNNILVQMSLDARNYRLTYAYADVISRMTLSVLLCYKFTSSWFPQAHSLFVYFFASCVKHNWAGTWWTQVPPGPLHTWGLSSKNTKDAEYCTKGANSANNLAVTSWHSKASPPGRVFTLVSWFLSIWTTLLITLSVSVVAEASLIFSEPKEITYDAPLCALCVCTIIITTSKSNSIVLEGYNTTIIEFS